MNSKSSRRTFLKTASSACAGLAIFLTFGLGSSFADSSATEKQWDKLSDKEKAAIEKQWESFKAMTPQAQEELRAGLVKYKALSEEQKQLVERAYAKWKNLSDGQKAEIKEKFLKWKELNAQQRAEVRDQVKKAMAEMEGKSAQ